MSKTRSTFECLYLYADGHAVCVFEKHDPDAGRLKYVEIHECFTKARYRHFTGRIIVSGWKAGMIELLKEAKVIEAKEPMVESGTEATKKLNIPVGHLCVQTKRGSLYFYDMPGLFSGDYTHQPGTNETFNPDLREWSGYNVARVHRVKAPAPAAVLA